MTLPENPPRPAAAGAAGKPSLLSDAAPTQAAGDSPTQPMRMLDALETSHASRPMPLSGQRATWLFALGLGVVAAVGYWAWDQSRSVVSPGLIEASRQSRAVDANTATTLTSATVAAPASESTPVAPVALDPSAGPASIERTAIADQKPATVRPFASAPVASPIRTTVSTSPPVASLSPTLSATLSATVAPAIAPVPPRAVAARPSPRPVPPNVVAAIPPSADPDVTLLSAMLARLSGDNVVASPRPTIAQLVERCEAHAANDSIEAFECKRRICVGYWGKADACPMALAPKKN